MNNCLSALSPLGQNPLVSCVIIFFNTESFLAEAIESVLTQTYEHWELLLVDDGSMDGSTEIAQSYARRNPQQCHYLEHLHRQNQGKNASRNLGIQQAKGQLIALLDGDDVWLPHKLEEQIAAFRQHPKAAMVYGRSQFWYSWTGKAEDQGRDHFFPNLGATPNTLVQSPLLVLDLLEGASQTPTTCNAILRREVFEMVGNFDKAYHDVFEDKAFFIKVMLYFPVFVADNYWARYRKRPESSYLQFVSAAQQKPALLLIMQLNFLHWVETYLTSQKYENSEVWQYLRQRQKQYRLTQRLLPIYTPWRRALDGMLQLGRRVLPKSWREWLWRSVGEKLYVE